jgi:hypothetical protein
MQLSRQLGILIKKLGDSLKLYGYDRKEGDKI